MDRRHLTRRWLLSTTLALALGFGPATCGPVTGENGNGEHGNGNNGNNGGNGEPDLTLEEKLEKLSPDGRGFNRISMEVLDEGWIVSVIGGMTDASGERNDEWAVMLYDTTDSMNVQIADIAFLWAERPEDAPQLWWPIKLGRLGNWIVVPVRKAGGELGIHVFEVRDGRLHRVGSLDGPGPSPDDTGLLFGVTNNAHRLLLLFDKEIVEVSVDETGQPSIVGRVTKPEPLRTAFASLSDDGVLIDLYRDLDLWSFGGEIGEAVRENRMPEIGRATTADRLSIHDAHTGLLYIMGTCTSAGEGQPMKVLDVASPAEPAVVANLAMCRDLGADMPRTLGDRVGSIHDDRLYLTWNQMVHRLLVLDLSEDPTAPKALGWIDPLGTNGAMYDWVHATADRLYFGFMNTGRDGTWVPLGWAPIDELEIEPIVEPDPQ